jgi:hypothetical protein
MLADDLFLGHALSLAFWLWPITPLRFSDYPAFLLELRLVDLAPRKTLL